MRRQTFSSVRSYSSTRPGFTLQIRAAEQAGKGEGAGAPPDSKRPRVESNPSSCRSTSESSLCPVETPTERIRVPGSQKANPGQSAARLQQLRFITRAVRFGEPDYIMLVSLVHQRSGFPHLCGQTGQRLNCLRHKELNP